MEPCRKCIFLFKGRCLVRERRGRYCKLKIEGLKITGWFVFMEDGVHKRVRVWNDNYRGSWANNWHYISPFPRFPSRYLSYALYMIGKGLGIGKVGKYLVYDARASSILHYCLVEKKIDGFIAGKSLLNLARFYPIAMLLDIRENDGVNHFLWSKEDESRFMIKKRHFPKFSGFSNE